jgi:hypothetical protein
LKNHQKCKVLGQFYAPQTKIWKVGQTFQKAFFEALFKGVSTLFGLHNVEKCFEKRFLKCLSDLPNLRLGEVNSFVEYIHPKRRILKVEQKIGWVFSRCFSRV